MVENQGEQVTDFIKKFPGKYDTYDRTIDYDYCGNIQGLIGCTITEIERREDETLAFYLDNGFMLVMQHMRDCCAYATIKEICGDLKDLIGNPLLVAERVTSEDNNKIPKEEREWTDSHTWTFYKFATIKGSVTIDWLGESNGYYNEQVCLTLWPIDRKKNDD